jgi:hypothetical protein
MYILNKTTTIEPCFNTPVPLSSNREQTGFNTEKPHSGQKTSLAPLKYGKGLYFYPLKKMKW